MTAMEVKSWQRVLAFYEPTTWWVTLISGETLVIYADSRGVEGDCDVFNVLISGQPPVLETVARVPTRIIRDIATDVGLSKPEDY
jgi:hypothetical protein